MWQLILFSPAIYIKICSIYTVKLNFQRAVYFWIIKQQLIGHIPCCFFYICSVMSNLCIVQHKNLHKKSSASRWGYSVISNAFLYFFYFVGMAWKSKLQSIDEDFKCGRHHLQFVPTTYVVTLLSFFYQQLVQNMCSNLQVATNMHQTMWQLLVLFSPHQQKLYYGQLIFFTPFPFSGCQEKRTSKTD